MRDPGNEVEEKSRITKNVDVHFFPYVKMTVKNDRKQNSPEMLTKQVVTPSNSNAFLIAR